MTMTSIACLMPALHRTSIAAIALAAFAFSAVAAAQHPAHHQHSFAGAEQWAKAFDDPKRDAWQKPHQVITALKLSPGAVVADIGAGTGYFAVRLPHFVPQGKVYAVDTEPDMVAHLARRAKDAGIGNLVALQGAADTPKLPEKADLVLLVDVYHHIGGREAYFRAIADALKPGGRIAIIDFNARSRIGPPVRDRIPATQVKREMAAAGFRVAQEHAFLPNQFFVVFRRAAEAK
jgi:SAM-dependent methyltransferase